MSINAKQLREHVVRPVLKQLDLWSESAENLILGTAAQESHMGSYIVQVKGPALGIYQMEPNTFNDIWTNYLEYKRVLVNKLEHFSKWDTPTEMVGNLYYATAMCRIHYLRVREALPNYYDVSGMAKYWKKYYNTVKGKGTEAEFIANYNWLVR